MITSIYSKEYKVTYYTQLYKRKKFLVNNIFNNIKYYACRGFKSDRIIIAGQPEELRLAINARN